LELAEISSQETKNKIIKTSLKNPVFPSLDSILKKDYIIENDINRKVNKHVNSTNNISSLKSILNKEKSPKKFKEDLNGLFSKKNKSKFDKNNLSGFNNDVNELSTNSNSRYLSYIFLLKEHLYSETRIDQDLRLQVKKKRSRMFVSQTK